MTGERLAMASGWRAAGEWVHSWHAADEKAAAAKQRLPASGWRAAADERLASGLRAACVRLTTLWPKMVSLWYSELRVLGPDAHLCPVAEAAV